MKKIKNNILIIFLIIFIAIFICIKITGNKETSHLPSYVNDVTVNEDFFQSMNEKELTVYKILNSIDFFKTAIGTYKYVDSSDNCNEIVKYYVDIDNKKSYVNTQSEDGEVNKELICTENSKIYFDNIKRVYSEFPVSKTIEIDYIRKLKPEDRYDKKSNEFISRQDGNFMVEVSEILFNQELQSYLKDYEKWNIQGEEDYLNRKAIYITGSLGFTSKNGSNKFELLVDKSTGIVLKLNFLNKDNKIISSLITTDIILDKTIESSIFEKGTSGYNKNSSGEE